MSNNTWRTIIHESRTFIVVQREREIPSHERRKHVSCRSAILRKFKWRRRLHRTYLTSLTLPPIQAISEVSRIGRVSCQSCQLSTMHIKWPLIRAPLPSSMICCARYQSLWLYFDTFVWILIHCGGILTLLIPSVHFTCSFFQMGYILYQPSKSTQHVAQTNLSTLPLWCTPVSILLSMLHLLCSGESRGEEVWGNREGIKRFTASFRGWSVTCQKTRSKARFAQPH